MGLGRSRCRPSDKRTTPASSKDARSGRGTQQLPWVFTFHRSWIGFDGWWPSDERRRIRGKGVVIARMNLSIDCIENEIDHDIVVQVWAKQFGVTMILLFQHEKSNDWGPGSAISLFNHGIHEHAFCRFGPVHLGLMH